MFHPIQVCLYDWEREYRAMIHQLKILQIFFVMVKRKTKYVVFTAKEMIDRRVEFV